MIRFIVTPRYQILTPKTQHCKGSNTQNYSPTLLLGSKHRAQWFWGDYWEIISTHSEHVSHEILWPPHEPEKVSILALKVFVFLQIISFVEISATDENFRCCNIVDHRKKIKLKSITLFLVSPNPGRSLKAMFGRKTTFTLSIGEELRTWNVSHVLPLRTFWHMTGLYFTSAQTISSHVHEPMAVV